MSSSASLSFADAIAMTEINTRNNSGLRVHTYSRDDDDDDNDDDDDDDDDDLIRWM